MHTSTKKAQCPRLVIPGCDQGPRLPELYNAGETHATITRFLVLARNDSMGAIVVTLQKTFVHINKRSRRLLASKMQNIERTNECQTRLNRRLAFQCTLLFFCSSVKTRHAPTKTAQCPRYVIPGLDQGPHIHNSTMPARALANYHH